MIDVLIVKARRLRGELQQAQADLKAGRLSRVSTTLAAAVKELDEALATANRLTRV